MLSGAVRVLLVWWWLLVALVVLGSLAVLGLALYEGYRTVKKAMSDVGRAGERVAEASTGLNAGLAQLQAAAPGAPPRTGAGAPRGDGAALAARVRGSR